MDNGIRRVRGPTIMPKVWARSEGNISVLFNEFGQPVDEKTTSQLTHFMGALARSGKYCPVHKQWHKVDQDKKKVLLDFLKVKFDLPPGSDDWILKSFGKKVRNWRARLKKDHFDPSLSLEEQIKSRPNRVNKTQWRRLVKYWNKGKSKRVSEKNKENRAKKRMVPLTGKKSYARVREQLKVSSSGLEPSRMEMFRSCYTKDGTAKTVEAENAMQQMEELSAFLPEGSIDEPGPEDIFSQVMGKDQNGDAGMFRLGVRCSDVWGVIPSRSACRRENMKWKSTCAQLSDEVANLKSMVLKLQVSGEKENDSDDTTVPFTSHCRNASNTTQPLRVGATVYLKNILNPTENLAKGWIKSLDPNDVVGGEEIGPNWCEVNVQVAIKGNERLVRPYHFIVTIQDAVGATVAWPCPFISVEHED